MPQTTAARTPLAGAETSPTWFKEAVLYELYVRAFRDTNGDGHGDLRGVIERLDYLRDLGVDVIWLLPLSPSPLRDDGYDVSDFTSIHPQYGTLEDFRTLVREAHARGLKVITDLVLNHTSSDHPWFQASRRREEGKDDWYVWSDDPERYAGTRVIFTDSEASNWSFDEVRGQYYWHRFFHHQPDLNYDHPEVRDEMKRVIRFWLELGIDGFRLDAIPYLFEREGTNNENIAETHAFLKEVRRLVDELRPAAFLLGEVNQWPEDTLPYFGDGTDEMPLLFHFPVMPRLYKAVAEGKVDALRSILDRTPAIPEPCQWVVFLRNHDELTLEMVTEEERAFMYDRYAPDPRMRLNVGIRRRLAPLVDNDRGRIELLHSMLMTLPGTPILYYGDEIGMGDDITLSDRNGVRTPMQWEGGPGAGFSDAAALYAPVIREGAYGNDLVNVAAQERDPSSLLWWVRHLVAQRREHAALGRGYFELLAADDPALAVFLNSHEGDVVVAVHNLAAEPRRLPLPVPRLAGRPFRLVFGGRLGGATPLGAERDGAHLEVDLGARGYAWWATSDTAERRR
jgi:maltose alpha-D-glucosyltransferase / alpha-amylase